VETTTRRVKLHKAQADFHHCPALFKAFVGGRGAGKSWCGAYDMLRRMRLGATYLIGSPTGILMQDTTFPTFKAIAQEWGVWGGVKMTPYPTATILLDGGNATVRFRTAEDPERMRGPNLSGAWLDEASLMHEDAYKIVIACLREGGRRMGFLTSTFTPKGKTHWTYQTFATGRPNTAIIHAKTGDNPFNPPEFEATIAGQYGETQFARQELGGEFVQMEGAEFPAEWFDYPGFWFDEWPTSGIVLKVLYLDPSKGRQAKPGDYQAFAQAALVQEPCGNNRHRNMIYIDAHMNREPVTAMVARGIRLAREWGPVAVIGYEDNGTLGFMEPEVERQLNEAKALQNWVPITSRDPKMFRIRGLGGYLSRRQIRIRNTQGGKILRDQMGEVPMGEHDDGPDAAAGAVKILEALTAGV
jgi:hypothetical protein